MVVTILIRISIFILTACGALKPCARHLAKGFTCIISFNPNNSYKAGIVTFTSSIPTSSLKNEQTEAQGREVTWSGSHPREESQAEHCVLHYACLTTPLRILASYNQTQLSGVCTGLIHGRQTRGEWNTCKWNIREGFQRQKPRIQIRMWPANTDAFVKSVEGASNRPDTRTMAPCLSADRPSAARLFPAAQTLAHQGWERTEVSNRASVPSPHHSGSLRPAPPHPTHTPSPMCSCSFSHEKEGFAIQGTFNKGTPSQIRPSSS